MRELKFRAWFPDEKRMEYNVFLSENGQPMYLEGGWDYMEDEEDAIIMQYTGLHDKNGVKIYEGDTLNFTVRVPGDPHDLVDTFRAAVEWDNHLCGFSPFIDGYEIEKYEVIGNIYENPELLD